MTKTPVSYTTTSVERMRRHLMDRILEQISQIESDKALLDGQLSGLYTAKTLVQAYIDPELDENNSEEETS